jgi:uncharacterized repeat protein (TIGR01451 family)
MALVGLVALSLLWSDPVQALQRTFALRFSLNATGDILIAANSNTTCSQAAAANGDGANCTDVQTTGAINRTNNQHTIIHTDVDTDASTFNSSRAKLNLPAGATVAFAGLYWGGDSTNAARDTVRLATPSSAGAYTTLTASVVDDSSTNATAARSYQGFVDITSIVSAAGAGTYTVANIATTVGTTGNTNSYSGWTLVVVYRLATEPTRNMVVYDGYQRVTGAANIDISLAGFTTPPFGTVTSKLGIVGYDGDKGSPEGAAGLQFGSSVATLGPVFNGLNPQTDIFNSTISTLGVNNPDRSPSYPNTLGFDADVFTPNTQLPNGATSALVRVSSSGETIDLGVVTLSTNIFVPIIKDTLVKTVTDVNGGFVLPGDVLEYTINFSNTGNDPATRTVVIDNVPANTTYLPGSIVYSSTSSDVPTGTRTDTAGNDSAEFDAAGNRVVMRVGRTPTATIGGQMNPSDNQTLKFRVTVNSGTPGDTVINNFATVTYRSLTLGTDFSDTSDSDTASPGDQPTQVIVASPDLIVLKTHSPATFAQQSVLPTTPTFSILVSNTGTAPTFGTVTVTDLLPAGLSALSITGTGWSCTLGTTSCTRTDTLAVGASYPPISLVVSANNSGTLTNSVTVACLCEGASRSGNNTGSDTVVVTPGASLTITKTNGASALTAGTTTTYTITVANLGPSAASGAVLEDPVAPGLSCSTVTCTTTGATCPTAPIAIANLQTGVAIPSFPANSSLTFVVNCAVTATGQ